MSQNALIQRSQNRIEEQQEHLNHIPVIDVFQPQFLPQIKIEQKLKKFYYPLQFPYCGEYSQPDLKEVQQKKKQKGESFAQSKQNKQKHKLLSFDGTFQQITQVDQSSSQIIRQKTRLARDGRQQFFEQTGQFVVQKQFFQEQLARLANISFQQNLSTKTFHKNAILSERNNQKKNVSFQLVLNFGGIFLSRHPLQNQQQKKFQEIRPLMKEWSVVSTYPILPQLNKEIQYLQDMKEHVQKNSFNRDQIQDLSRKLNIIHEMYDKQKRRIEELMRNIVTKWKQLKDIRNSSGIETVPWKFNIKQYQTQTKRKSYDIGMTPFELQSISNQNSSFQAQINRRQIIKQQKYFIRVFINDNEVAKTQKFNLQWPSFKVPLNEQVNITVYSAPYKISIQIVKSGIINHVIDTVNLSLPGANAKTITASEKKYASINFSSNGKEVKQGKQSKPPSGTVLYMIEWKGQGSRMPPSISAKTSQQDTVSTQQSEVDLLENVQLVDLFDTKDPREQHKSYRQRVQDEINEGSNNLLPFANVQSTRILLLRLRNQISDLQRMQIPILQEQIQRRQDLLQILNRQRKKNNYEVQARQHRFFHPCENKYFTDQPTEIIQSIRNLLSQIEGLKLFSNRSLNTTSVKYKIAQQIINQHIFQQMESPIIIFFKDLFTQKRKLGPRYVYKAQPRAHIEDIQINLHVRSARNLPIRENSQQSIKQYLEGEKRYGGMGMTGGMLGMGMGGGMYPQNGGMYPNNMQMYQNYGMGMYNQRPNITMTGHTFFNPNLNNPNRINQQINYDSKNSLQRLNTSVELKFKKSLKRTQCFEGPFPQWNQTLSFNYNIKNENSSIQKIFYNNQKLMKVIIFDITEESKPTNVIAKIQIKKTKYYIGRIQIPFGLITVLPTLSGIWKVDRPIVTFSYSIMKKQMFSNENPLQRQQQLRIDTPSYINLDMFTEPSIDTFIAYNTDRKFIPGQQNPLLLQKASDWLEDLNTKRYVKLWLNNLNQKSIFICRFLSDNVCPPQFIDKQIERCAKFVSLLPRKYNCQLLQNTEEFHLKVDQLLKLKMSEDHGILLCNYFNFLDKKYKRDHIQSYLIIGKAFPYGKTMFVLRRDKQTNHSEIWDPFKGQSYFIPAKQFEVSCFCIKTQKKLQNNYNSKDICPLFQATCVVSRKNVYVNKQEGTNPYIMNFNLDETDLWIPFLTQRTRLQYETGGQIKSIQPEIDPDFYKVYYPQDKHLSMDIQKDLYDFIRHKMQEQRKNHFSPYIFKMDTKISKKIGQKLLLQCENFRNDFRMSGKQSPMYERNSYQQYSSALSHLQQQKNNIKNSAVASDKNLFGFTMNFTYTTNDEIWQKIEDTQIHLDENQNIEFVLSVKCFEYPCHMYSVWIFIGRIE